MIETTVGYQTGSGNKMAFDVYGIPFFRQSIETVSLLEAEEMCHYTRECKGKNGCCPPYSVHFSKLKSYFDTLYVLVQIFDVAYALDYAGWRRGTGCPAFLIIKYADRLSMNYAQRILKTFESEGYYTIGLSNCPGCRPKDCTVIRGGKCKFPAKRRYSMEACGVLCDKLHISIFDEIMPWWFKTPEHMPSYVARYSGVFTNADDKTVDAVLEYAVKNDQSYIDEIKPLTEYDLETLIVPDSVKCWSGEEYEAYRIPVEQMEKNK